MSIFLFDSGQGHSACFVGTSLPDAWDGGRVPSSVSASLSSCLKGERGGRSSGFQARITNSAAVNVLVTQIIEDTESVSRALSPRETACARGVHIVHCRSYCPVVTVPISTSTVCVTPHPR